nr:hypothetical protein [Rhodococcus qingshengii]
MPIVAHTRPFVIGVDTRACNHSYAILSAVTGELMSPTSFQRLLPV